MKIPRLIPIVVCALTAVIVVGAAGEPKSSKREIAAMTLEWQKPKLDTVYPSNSIIRNFSAEPCEIKSTREPQITVRVLPGETIYVGIDFRFQKVPDKVEMTTIPFVTATGAIEGAKKSRE